MATKYVSPENLDYFKDKQDAGNSATFAAKTDLPSAVSELENDSGYVTQTAMEQAISSAVASVFSFKGSKPTSDDLPSSGNKTGDVWHVEEDGGEYVWTGSEWESFGIPVSITWDAVQGKPSAFTPTAHTHTKSQITDFPTSMPASDVSAWAKAASKPTYTYSEVGAAAAGHGHATMGGASSTAAGTAGMVPAPGVGKQASYLRGDGSWSTPHDTTYSVATQSSNGLMSSADKTKLDGLDDMVPMDTAEIDALFAD